MQANRDWKSGSVSSAGNYAMVAAVPSVCAGELPAAVGGVPMEIGPVGGEAASGGSGLPAVTPEQLTQVNSGEQTWMMVPPAGDGLARAEIDKIANTPWGGRPDPSTYLSQEYIDAHLARFQAGEYNMEKIFEGNGIEILKRDGKYYLKYDAGEIACRYKELEISPEDAEKAQKSAKGSHDVLYEYLRKQPSKPYSADYSKMPEEIRRKIFDGFKK